MARLSAGGMPDLVVGPSGYGLPLRRAAEASDADLRLAFLAAPDEPGGISGIRGFARVLGASGLPVVYIPGVVHLDTVPRHRKLNRVDLGTADKLSATALAIWDRHESTGRPLDEISLILLELGGAFTAGIAVERGQVVDGVGGTCGPMGWRAAGGLDGEVAFLAGQVSKDLLFRGGVETVMAEQPGLAAPALEAFLEGAVKLARQLAVSAPQADEVVLSGRRAEHPGVRERLARELADLGPVRVLKGFEPEVEAGRAGRGTRWPMGWPVEMCSSGGSAADSRGRWHGARPPLRDLRRRRDGGGWGSTMRDRDGRVLIAGVSTRALAQSAARAGYQVTRHRRLR